MAHNDQASRSRPRPARLHARTGHAAHVRSASRARCDAAARWQRTAEATPETPDPDTDARLTEHRLDPPLDRQSEPGDETPRGTIGRGTLSVEARRTASALDDSSALSNVLAPEPRSSRELVSDQPSLVAIGGSGTMSLHTFRPIGDEPYEVPSASSMRFMETGLAFAAILVALLLNLGR